MTTHDPTPAAPTATVDEAPYGRVRLVAGLLGRTWLWFLAGCLLVTLLPLLLGWRPFLIESGSMEPRIDVGDVVIASPEQDPAALLGHVTVFSDPDRPGRYKTHRVVEVADDGTLVTHGDANATNDPTPVDPDEVVGIGRLLVQFVGLPVVWARTGEWLWLLLFAASVGLAILAVTRDREEDTDPGSEGPPDPDDLVPSPSAADQRSSFDIAATRPFPFERRAERPASARWGARLAYATALALALVLPTATAAFSRTTSTAANSWTVPNWSYTQEVRALTPYLYWKFDETGTDTVAADSRGTTPARPGQYNPNGDAANFTRLTDGALVTDTPDRAVALAGTNASTCINTASTTLISGQTPVTVVIWFRAPSTYNTGGKLAGFEKPRTGQAVPSTGTYDRHLYMDGSGYVWFGVYNGGFVTIRSNATLNNNAWHMAVGTVGPAGTNLYIDGVLQGTNANTQGENTDGVWRAGCGNLGGWGGSWNGPNNPTTNSNPAQPRIFRNALDEFSVFTQQLTQAQISMLWAAR